jgi:anti-sigma factor RsiW
MTCHAAQPLIGAYLDGELELARSLELEAHWSQCAACAALLESHKEVSAALTAAPYYRASGRLRARVEGRLAVRRVAPWLALTAAFFLQPSSFGAWLPCHNPSRQKWCKRTSALSWPTISSMSAPPGTP